MLAEEVAQEKFALEGEVLPAEEIIPEEEAVRAEEVAPDKEIVQVWRLLRPRRPC